MLNFKMKIKIELILFFVIFFSCMKITAQVSFLDSIFRKNAAVIIFTNNDKEITGLVSLKKDSSVIIKMSVKDSVQVMFLEIDTAYIANEDNFLKGKYVNPNIFSPFNYTFSTAFPIPKKTIFIRTTSFCFASAHVGLSKSLGLSYFTSLVGVPMAVNVRYSLKINNHLFIAPEAGILSASWVAPKLWLWSGGIRTTQGNSQKNITIGIGYFQINGLNLPKNILSKDNYKSSYINFGIQQRISKKISILAEAWYFASSNFITVGIYSRHHKKPSTSWSFGSSLLCFKDLDKKNNFIPIPMLQWSTRF